MVLAMVGHPLRQRALHRHAAEDRRGRLDGLARLEAPVGEVAVEADRRPERADDIEARRGGRRSTQWKATPQSSPIAERSPSGGTTTATSVTSWLIATRPASDGRDRRIAVRASRSSSSSPCVRYRHVANPLFARPPNIGCDRSSMRIAVVGSGIVRPGSRATACHAAHDVEVFERDDRAGGHVNTIAHGGLALDTGFLVHNDRNYPRLVRLFSELGVRAAAVGDVVLGRLRPPAGSSSRAGGRSRSGGTLQAPGSSRSSRSRALAPDGAARARGRRLRGTLAAATISTSAATRAASGDHFLVPLTSALWSTAPGRALEFPAAYAIRFFDNHGMLGFGRFAWRTVAGGADTYVARPLRPAARPAPPRARRARASARRRTASSCSPTTASGGASTRSWSRRTPIRRSACSTIRASDERRVLGAFGYTKNEAVLHTDASLLPPRRSARASWNYRARREDSSRPTITYYAEPAAAARAEKRLLRDAEPQRRIADDHVIARMTYEHPLYTLERSPRSATSAPSRARGTRTTRAPTTATASTRTGSPPGCGRGRARGRRGELGALHRLARSTPGAHRATNVVHATASPTGCSTSTSSRSSSAGSRSSR